MQKFLVVLLAVILAVTMGLGAGIGCSSEEETPTAEMEPITWHYWCSTAAAPSFPADWHSETFAEEVTDKSGGRLTIEIHYKDDLPFANTDFLKVIGGGDVEIGYAGGSYKEGEMPQLAHYSTPFMIGEPFAENMVSLLDDPEIKAIRDGGFDELNVKEMGIVAVEANALITKDSITKLSDLEGMELRAWSPALIETFQALGAVPHTVPFGELYLALSTGLVDGTSNSVLVATSVKLYEVTDYVCTFPIVSQIAAMVVNKDAYEALPADLQVIVDEAAQRWEERCRAEYLEVRDTALAEVQEYGMEVTELEPGEHEKIMDKMNPVWEAKGDTLSGDSLKVWNRIREILGY